MNHFNQQEWVDYVERGLQPALTCKPKQLIYEEWKVCCEKNLRPYVSTLPKIQKVKGEAKAENYYELVRQIIASHFIGNVSQMAWVVCNPEGRIVHLITKEEQTKGYMEAVGLKEGHPLALEEAGVNGVSYAMRHKKELEIIQYGHFLNIFHELISCGTPLYNLEGKCMAYVGIFGHHTMNDKRFPTLLRQLASNVDMSSRLERSGNLNQQYKQRIDMIFSDNNEPTLGLTKSGVLKFINGAAAKVLNIDASALDQELDGLVNFTPKIRSFSNNAIDENINLTFKQNHKTVTMTCQKSACYNSQDGFLGNILVFTDMSKNKIPNISSSYNAPYTFDSIIGESPAIKRVKTFAHQVADSQVSVLLIGESGTGKEVFAQSIHNESKNEDGPFVSINCSAIPKDLAESELFGYEEGAFTGSKKGGHIGKLELANSGTLFLDEIGDMPTDLQVKLLRALETRTITRVGGSKEIPVEFRVIAATNRHLEALIDKGDFREDLYYRLAVSVIHLPALRDCAESIPELFSHYISYYSEQMGKKVQTFQEGLLEKISNYDWRGNIRELKNAAEFAVMMNKGSQPVSMEHLPGKMRMAIFYGQERIETVSPSAMVPSQPKSNVEPTDYELSDRHNITRALRQCKGNAVEAAEKLGVSRATIYRKMKKLKMLMRDRLS